MRRSESSIMGKGTATVLKGQTKDAVKDKVQCPPAARRQATRSLEPVLSRDLEPKWFEPKWLEPLSLSLSLSLSVCLSLCLSVCLSICIKGFEGWMKMRTHRPSTVRSTGRWLSLQE